MSENVYRVSEAKNLEEKEGFVKLPIARTDGKKGKSGNAIMAHAITANTMQAILNDEVGAAWMISQVNALRSVMASALHKAGSTITREDIALTALLEAMKKEEGKQRFSKDAIASWFDAVLCKYLSAALEAKGIPAGVAEKTLEAFKTVFCKLSAREVSLTDAEKDQLVKAMGLIPEDSEDAVEGMTERIAEKLAEAADKKVDLLSVL